MSTAIYMQMMSSSTTSSKPNNTNTSKNKNNSSTTTTTTTDWNSFYQNGYPKEVIVISSDEEDEGEGDYNSNENIISDPRITSTLSNSSAGKKRLLFSDNSTTTTGGSSSRTSTNYNSDYHYYSSSEVPASTNKRRKRQAQKSGNHHHHHHHHSPSYISPVKPIEKPKDIAVGVIPDKASIPSNQYDDQDGHYIINANSEFAGRYQISKLLGQGTFGKVVAAYDKVAKRHCAIKIIRAVQKYRDASRIELRVLSTLSKYDYQNSHRCIHLRDCFDYRNHICIVTDLLGISIYDFMKSNGFHPFPGGHVQSFAKQLLKSVSFLHDLSLVHTDLKPENILLTDSSFDPKPYVPNSSASGHTKKPIPTKIRNVLKNTEVHLIDFGSAIFNDEYHSSVVSTRHYRAPEIILGTGWSYPCDVWSIACILIEFCTGEALFQTHDNLEHLALMEKIIGRKIDTSYAKYAANKCQANGLIDRHTGKILYPNNQVKESSQKYVKSVKNLSQLIKQVPNYKQDKMFWDQFLDLLLKMLQYDPKNRISAKDALRHPWFEYSAADDY